MANTSFILTLSTKWYMLRFANIKIVKIKTVKDYSSLFARKAEWFSLLVLLPLCKLLIKSTSILGLLLYARDTWVKKKSIIVHIFIINRHKYEMILHCEMSYTGGAHSLQ